MNEYHVKGFDEEGSAIYIVRLPMLGCKVGINMNKKGSDVMRIKNRILCFLIFAMAEITFLTACNLQKTETNMESERHAFWIENELIFIADVPENWRYILYPKYNHGDYRDEIEGTDCGVRFVGKGKEDRDDNFFQIFANAARRGTAYEYINPNVDYIRLDSNPFTFCDGTAGKWNTEIWEESFFRRGERWEIFYRAFICDAERKNYIELNMLKDEYDVNEQDIISFLNSSCFRISDLGISKEENVLKRELLTLHIWNPLMQLSVEVPEGVELGYKIRPYWDRGGDNCLYYIYLDKEKKNYIEIEADPDGWYIEPSGDFHYYLNREDFKETVYEIPMNFVTSGDIIS